MHKPEKFTHNGVTLDLQFVETIRVFEGVTCDVYVHPETKERDLGIIYIEAGKRTKSQRVLSGAETIEGYISGTGVLLVIKPTGERLEFPVGPESVGFAQTIEVGDIMQWQAHEALVVFEICYPPYAEGRYENLEDETIK